MERVDPLVRELQVRRFREMSAERKLELSGEMREFAWELRVADLRTRFPGVTEAEIRRRLRLRFPDVASWARRRDGTVLRRREGPAGPEP